MAENNWYDKMEYEKLTYFGYPIYNFSDFEHQKGMVSLNFFWLKHSRYNIMSYSTWLDKLGG